MIIYAGQAISWPFTTHKAGSESIPSAPDATPVVTEWIQSAVSATAAVTLVSGYNYKAVITTPLTLSYGDSYRLVATYAVNGLSVTQELINELCSSSEGGESPVSAEEPVTVAQVKTRLRIAHTTDDVLIAELITTARLKVEELCSCACLTATKTRTLDSFPSNSQGIIYPPIRPLIAVTSITYYDTANALQTFNSAYYEVDVVQRPGRVRPVYGQYWPSTYDRLDAVTITYTAGYGATSATVPWMIRQGILYFVADLYRNRENLAIGVSGVHNVPHTAMHYLADYLDRRIA